MCACLLQCTVVYTYVYSVLHSTGWSLTSEENKLVVSKLDVTRTVPDIRYCVSVFSDMVWKIFIYRRELIATLSQVTATIPEVLSNAIQLSHLLCTLDRGYMCEGNKDAKFDHLLSSKKFSGNSSKF